MLTDEAKDEKRSATKQTVEAESHVKKDKKAKTEKPPKAADTEVQIAQLKPAQVQKLKDTHEKVTKAEDVFATCRARITGAIEQHCPKFIIEKAATQAAEFASTKASIDFAVESANGDFKLLMREAGTVMKHSKTLKDSLSNILDEAEAHVTGR